jgi:hypothetical protein
MKVPPKVIKGKNTRMDAMKILKAAYFKAKKEAEQEDKDNPKTNSYQVSAT